jgi:hypothetical protein
MPITYFKIASVTVGSGGAASIDFTSIPATYTDLLIKISSRTTFTGSGVRDQIAIKFNASSTSDYSDRWVYGIPSIATSSFGTSSATFSLIGYTSGNSSGANTFGSAEVYIPNYASNTNKSASGEGVGEDNSASTGLAMSAILRANTAAITSISIISYNAANLLQYSTATLYGIKKD